MNRRVFERAVARLDRKIAHLEAANRRLSWARLVAVLGGLIAAALGNFLFGEPVAWCVLVLALAAFVWMVKQHNRIETHLARHRIYRRIKSTHLARLDRNWAELPPARPVNHPLARDLDLGGERSLLRLLDTTRSKEARSRLEKWILSDNPDEDAIKHRQGLVAELLPLTGFRERLALNSAQTEADLDRRWDGATIHAWLNAHPPGKSLKPWVILLGALSVLTLTSAAATSFLGGPTLWSVTWPLYLILYFGLYAFHAKKLGTLLRDADHLASTLAPFQSVLSFVEHVNLERRPRLKTLCAPLQTSGQRPSRAMVRLGRVAGAARWQQGQLLWVLLNALVPWDLFFTFLLHQCKAELKDRLPEWLNVWHDLEALCALASFGAMHTTGCFPKISYAPVFEARDLGHPLIPVHERVCNDIAFRGPGDVVIVTGSNMSGKSTFLRTLGINLCLAYAGAPVLASEMKTGLFRLATCIAVSDSVTDGLSYFYAEVKRLQALLAELNRNDERPLFFLIDEIFRGTNNRERLIGSRSYIRALTARNGLGMISTHDLDLTQLEQDVSGIRNSHFRETIEHGKMVFDYKLRPGPCPTTNALAIMKLEGLPVDEDTVRDHPKPTSE